MTEMIINNKNIADFGARLLEYNVGGTEVTRTFGTSLNANFPKLFHSDFGQRKISITLVFKPMYLQDSGIIAKLHSLALQKSSFDSIICGGIIDIKLPDDFYYNCILNTVSDEAADGESLEVTYTLSGIRHLEKSTIKGLNVNCSSTVKTDCKITITVGSGWTSGTALKFIINSDTFDYNSITVNNVSQGDIIVIDGINCTVTKNGTNIFGDTNIVIFPYLQPMKNTYTLITDGEIRFCTEYYPTFI